MPKLKYKSKSSKHHKSSSKKKKDHSHRHHSHHRPRHYTPPTLYEDDEGSVPPSQASKSTEEEEWRQKLFEAMVDDEDPFYTYYDDSSSNPQSQQMSDDAYADYINQAMYRKRHADEIAQHEARLRARAKRKAEKEEAQRKMEEEQKKHEQQVHDTMRREDRQKQLQRGLDRYTLLWERLQPPAAITNRRDVPWPTVGSRITLENVRAFVVNHTTKQLRQEQLRYHPDKFMPRIQQLFKGSQGDLEWIRQKDNEVAGWLNELWAERTK
jgi:hypothetical protein